MSNDMTTIEPPDKEGPFQKLQRLDAQREGVPGEHWMTLAAGLGLWLVSRRSPSFLLRTLGMIASTAMVGRAASGRDGLAKALRYLPVGRSIRRY